MASADELYLGLLLGLVVATSRMMLSNPKGMVFNSLILYVLLGLKIGFGITNFVRMMILVGASYYFSQGRTNIGAGLVRVLGDKKGVQGVIKGVKGSIENVVPEGARETINQFMSYLD